MHIFNFMCHILYSSNGHIFQKNIFTSITDMVIREAVKKMLNHLAINQPTYSSYAPYRLFISKYIHINSVITHFILLVKKFARQNRMAPLQNTKVKLHKLQV